MFASNIALAKKYDYLAEKFTKAYDWLANNDVTKMEDGRYDICDGVFALVQRYTTMPFEKARFEAHNDYFDIQYIAEGEESFGKADSEPCGQLFRRACKAVRFTDSRRRDRSCG